MIKEHSTQLKENDMINRITKIRFTWALFALFTLIIVPVQNVFATVAKINPHGDAITGTITETMNAVGYTYMNIATEQGPVWVAIPETEVKQGDKISCSPGMEMKQFHSKSLDRTFETIIFSEGISGSLSASPHRKASALSEAPTTDSFEAAVQAERAETAKTTTQPNPSGGSMAAIAPFAEITVDKAVGENSYTIEELFSKAKELNGKTVRVHGKVVKYNANIMGRHWLHIQDGTGDPMQNTHDLVVTTQDKLTDPDILTIEGVLAADKDFGSGYTYSVIIENSKIIK